MGLGKTVTMLSHVASTMPEAVVFANRPHKVIDGKICKHIKATLVVMKLSLLENTWVPEIEKHFNPETLSFCKFHGPDRSQLDLSQHDIILTTYEVLRYEFKQRSKSSSIYNYEWFRIILDEAHEIRNYSSQGAMACRAVNAERRWAMSGTPFQNSFDDIGSLMAFLQVVPINRPQAFTKYITAPIMSRDTYGFWAWEILRDSLFLRRTKDSLSLGLPKKEEIIIKLRFEPKEQDIHDRLFKNYSKQLQKLQDKLQDRLGNKIYMNALTIFVKMRRFCAHKQELLGAEELKIMEDALNTEEDDADQGSTRFNKEAALDLLYVSYSGEADHCVRCRQSVCHSVDNNDENASSQILCHVLPPDCWRILCDPCFEEYKNSVKALPGNKNKIVACDICMKTHSINTIKISRKDWQNCLSRHTLINSNSRLAKARGAYTGPSVKVKYLLQHLEQLKMLEAAHPEEDPVKT
jgi:SNF2 family DNA or RNA helicase